VALADFYVTDAWRAWDVGWSKDVKPEDWKLYKERLEKANEVLYRPGMKIEAEPSIAGLRVVVAMGLTPDDQPVMMAAVAEAQKHWPGWYPVYDNVARAMLPRWGGKLGESARFAETEANRISGAEGDGLYAMLAAMVLETEGVGEFPNSGFDMARFLRGLDVLASRGEDVYRHFPRQRAAYLEAKFGDAAKARERIFACGPNVIPLAYGDVSQVFPTWEKCGVMEELQKGVELEKAGKLREALAIYGVLSSENPNPWVSAFALRNGVANLWPIKYGTPMLGLPIEKADPSQIFEMAGRSMCAADLDTACEYARAFDRARPQNITGKYILIASAALQNDKVAFDAEKARFLAMDTNREGYQVAQKYAGGELAWEAAKKQLPRDQNFIQSISMMGAVALGEGRTAEAMEIFRTVHRELPFQEDSAFAESMLWGLLARKFPERLKGE
jgi:hypothetical protein